MNLRWLLIALVCTALLPLAAMAPWSAADASSQSGQGDSCPAQDRNNGPDSDWDNDTFFQSLFQMPVFAGRSDAYLYGFRAGYEDGRRDMEGGLHWNFGSRYRNPDHYRLEYGDRDDYTRDYRDGYEQGYRHGFSKQGHGYSEES
jgi:hypothetical protein